MINNQQQNMYYQPNTTAQFLNLNNFIANKIPNQPVKTCLEQHQLNDINNPNTSNQQVVPTNQSTSKQVPNSSMHPSNQSRRMH